MEAKILEVLRELENIKGRESLFWNVPRTTGEFLNILVRVSGAKKALEIGTSNGYSGIYIAEGLSHNGGLLYTVESNDERYKLAAKNFKKAGVLDFVRQIKGHAPEILPEVGSDFDMVFIDATKMEYKSYLDSLIPMLKGGGFVVADNCLSHADEVRDYVSYLNSRPDMKNVLLSFDNGLMLSLKAGDR